MTLSTDLYIAMPPCTSFEDCLAGTLTGFDSTYQLLLLHSKNMIPVLLRRHAHMGAEKPSKRRPG